MMFLGTGKSKKVAKRNAAHAMLQVLKLGAISLPDGEQTDEFDEDSIPLPSEHSTYSALKEGKMSTLSSKDNQKISQFYQKMKKRAGKTLTSLQTMSLNAASIKYCQMLQEIAEEQRFEVNFVEIEDLNQQGQSQCLAQLSTMPVAVCHGTGSSTDDARAQAAHNALQYLKIMTKK